MGRAMLIICSAVLISMGFISMSTSQQGKLLTQNNVDYAEFTMAKNTAHSAIQLAMQEINQDDSFLTTYHKDNPWTGSIEGREFDLYIDALNDVAGNDYWESDSIRIVSNATQYIQKGNRTDSITAEVVSLYLKESFSSLVPGFEGAMTFAADPDKYTFSGGGNASISGESPTACAPGQQASMPGISVQPGGEDNLADLDKITVDADPPYSVNPDLSYQPTDELIARLLNSPGATRLSGDWADPLGTAEQPGVFFVDNYMKLNGKQKEGFGILVVKADAYMEYADSTSSDPDASLDINGNFEWNGLIIFEDAYNFKGRGTPKINGSVLVGHTEDYNGPPINIDISGNINFQYDCQGEAYAQMAAADAVKQNRFTRVVTTEGSNFTGN